MMPLFDPKYTSPFATAGDVIPLPVARPNTHATSSPPTFDGLRVFSVELNPRWVAVLWNCGQLARTLNDTCAAEPLRRPIAVIQCVPGDAELGTVIEMPEKAPCAFVVAKATSLVSK